MIRKSAAFLAALGFSYAPVRAADGSAATWKYDNPFCSVVASVAPIPTVVAAVTPTGGEWRYVLALFTRTGTTLAAHVTLVSDAEAYDAAVSDGDLSGTTEDRKLEPVVVTLPHPDQISYFFVDSYSLDRSASVTCPSYVFPVGETSSGVPTGLRTIEARHVQSLGSLSCGHAYIPAELRGDLQSPVGRYGGKPLTVKARAYIDSNGYSLREEIVQSSGVDGMDKYLLGAISVHQFNPAQFLCVPVVGLIEVELRYFP